MAQALPTQPIQTHLVRSALVKFGVSSHGAFEVMNGLPLSSSADRNAVLGLIDQLLHGSLVTGIASVATDKDKAYA